MPFTICSFFSAVLNLACHVPFHSHHCRPVQLRAATARGWMVGANGSVEHAGLLGRRLLRRRVLESRNVKDAPPLHSSRYCLARCATATACEDVWLFCLANRMVTSGGWGAGQWVAASIAAFPVAPIPDARDERHASDHDDYDIAQQLTWDEDRRDSAKDDGHDDQAGEGRHELTAISPVTITPFTSAPLLSPPEQLIRGLVDVGHETARPIPQVAEHPEMLTTRT